MQKSQYEAAIQEIDQENEPTVEEMVHLKRQKKILSEDPAEASNHSKLEDACVSFSRDKVMGDIQLKPETHDQVRFCKECLQYYQAKDDNWPGTFST